MSTDFEDLGFQDEVLRLVRTKNGTVSISRKGVFNMASKGFTVQDIADMFGVNRDCLYKNFPDELKAGKATIKPNLKANLLRQALALEKPAPALLIFALKNWAGMSDDGFRDAADNDDGEPGVEFKVVVPKAVLKAMTPAETPSEDG